MNRLLLIMYFTLVSIFSYCQLDTDWSRAFTTGDSYEDVMHDMSIDSKSNTIYSAYLRNKVVQITNGNQVLFSDTAGFRESIIFKLDSNGNFLWSYRIDTGWDGHAYSVTTDKFDYVYVFGTFEGTVDFDNDTSTFILTDNNSITFSLPSHFVLKLDPLGKFVWAKNISVSGLSKTRKIIVSNNGDVFLAGPYSGLADFDPSLNTFNSRELYKGMYILKLDSLGNFQWVKEWGDRVSLKAININSEGDISFSGNFQYTVDFDPGPDTASITSHNITPQFISGFICQLDSNGNFRWVNHIPAIDLEISDMLTDKNDNLYLYGRTYEALINFDVRNSSPNSQLINPTGQGELFYVKYNKLGNFLWLTNLGYRYQQNSSAATIDPDGFGYLSTNYTAGFQRFSKVISKIDPNGSLYWTKEYPSSYASISYFTSLKIDPYGNLFGAGKFGGTLFGQTGSGFMIKINDYTAGIEELSSINNNIYAYPNPVKNLLNITSDEAIDEIEILNLNGKSIMRTLDQVVSFANLPIGFYLVRIKTKKGVKAIKVSKI